MKIESQKLNVAETFSNYYKIPDYQREYVWKERNVHQLLDDIYEEYNHAGATEYFIGSIVVNKVGDNAYEVIDGQQRLTTLYITLCAFKHLFAKKEMNDYVTAINNLLTTNKVNSFGEMISEPHLSAQYIDTEGLLDQIYQGTKLNRKLTGSAMKIAEAYDSIEKYLMDGFVSEEDLKMFYGYFLNRVNFIQIETPSISDALKIFETINERGIGLNPMDLLKNLIFRQLPKDQFSQVNAEWKIITSLLDKNKQKPLRFLRYFIMANYQIIGTRDNDVVREDEIYDWLVKNADVCQYQMNPNGFVLNLTENAEAYVHFLAGKGLDDSDNAELFNIRSLGGGAYSQHLVVLLAAKHLKPELFKHLTKQLETIVFYYFITKTPAKELEIKFSRWADELRRISGNDEEQKRALNAFISKNMIAEKKNLETEFKLLFSNLGTKTLQQFRVKYILAKFAEYVDTARDGGYEPLSLAPYLESHIEIEHILPQTPTEELLHQFANADEYEEFCSKLGNLTLLEKPINVIAGNNFYIDKVDHYKASKFYITRSLVNKDDYQGNNSIRRINDKLTSFSSWSSETIVSRQEMLYQISRDIWTLEVMP